jgi:regulatory protein
MSSQPTDAPSPTGEEQLERALGFAYAYLNRRERTISEVRNRLQGMGISAELTQAAIRTLSEQGYLDDARFAKLFVSDKRELEQWGSERIKRGLLGRGIDRELAERALEGCDDGQPTAETELERALALLARRFPSPPADRRERERALGVLLRKGYESELALDALSAYARES